MEKNSVNINPKLNPEKKVDESKKIRVIDSSLKKMTHLINNILDDCNTEDEMDKIIKQIEEFIAKKERILYSEISNIMFAKNESFINKLEKLIEYSSEKDKDEVTRVLIKMWDHSNLASRQYDSLKNTKTDMEAVFNEFIMPIKDTFSEQITGASRSLVTQLISLVGIFTAMSFLVFGGISSLDNIFSGADISITKLVIVGCIWSLCMINLIFTFIHFVNKLLGNQTDFNCEKYVINVNFLFITIFLLAVVVRIMETDKLIYYCEQFLKGAWILTVIIVVAVIGAYKGSRFFFCKKE